MKSLKISLTTIVFAVILTISTGVFATTTATLDDSIIAMPGALNDGKGTVSSSIGTVSYQFVLDGISNDSIALINRYEEEIALIKAYNNYEAEVASLAVDPADTSAPSYQTFKSLEDAYKSKYTELSDGTDFGSTSAYEANKVDVLESKIIALYGDFDDSKWVSAVNSSAELDLSTFKGTKNAVLWVRTSSGSANQYRPQWYKVTGTQTDAEPQQEQEQPKDNTVKEAKKIQTAKKDGSSTSTSIPHAGVSDVVVGAMAAVASIGGVSYIRYRKIK